MAAQFWLAHLTILGGTQPEMVYVAARTSYDFISPRPIYMGLHGEPYCALAEDVENVEANRSARVPTPALRSTTSSLRVSTMTCSEQAFAGDGNCR